jgi:hypothetical protein
MSFRPRSKYGAVQTTVDGITFHSAKEARRYQELKLLQQAGEILSLQLQPEYDLVAGDTIIGVYRADFSYLELQQPKRRNEASATRVVEDVKGIKTPLYKWKKKHVEAQYGIQIRET